MVLRKLSVVRVAATQTTRSRRRIEVSQVKRNLGFFAVVESGVVTDIFMPSL